MATAKNRALDQLRRKQMLDRSHLAIASDAAGEPAVRPDLESAIDEDVGDDLLRLILVACHPVLSTEARVALTCASSAGSPPRRSPGVSCPGAHHRPAHRPREANPRRGEGAVRGPAGEDLTARLASVLEVIYLIFNEGYAATRRRRSDPPRPV
jgi:predicted RNA polymerase sigma factor